MNEGDHTQQEKVSLTQHIHTLVLLQLFESISQREILCLSKQYTARKTQHTWCTLSRRQLGRRRVSRLLGRAPLEALLVAAARPKGAPQDLEPAARPLHRRVDPALEVLEGVLSQAVALRHPALAGGGGGVELDEEVRHLQGRPRDGSGRDRPAWSSAEACETEQRSSGSATSGSSAQYSEPSMSSLIATTAEALSERTRATMPRRS